MNITKLLNGWAHLVLTASIVLGAGFFAFVLVPKHCQVEEFKYQNNQMDGTERVIDSLMTKIIIDKDAPRLVALNETPRVIEEITALGGKHSIIFLSVLQQDKKISKLKKINALPLQLETISTYKGLVFFMDELSRLHSGIILIDDFKISADKQEPDKVRSNILLHISLKKDRDGKK